MFHETFRAPFARTPTTDKDDASDVLIEGKADPHTDKTETKRDTYDVTQADRDAPLEDDAHDEGIDRVTRGTKGIASEDVGGAANFEEPINDEYPYAHCDNVRIVGEGLNDGPTSYCQYC